MVVTLEPCNHTGRTPPCTDAISAAGIERVVVAAIDPDAKVSGSGIAALRGRGVDVEVAQVDSQLGVRAEQLDPGYFHHRRTGRARLILKTAATLDGQTAAADGTSQWITGAELRERVHLLRSTVDAVMVGAGTLRDDDPLLTVRVDGYAGAQPRPVVVAGERPLPMESLIWQRTPIVISARPIEIPTGDLIICSAKDGRVDIAEAMTQLPDHGVLQVLVEAGARLAGSIMRGRLVDVGVTHLGGKLGAGVGAPMFEGVFPTIDSAIPVSITSVEQIGNDLEIQWVVQ